MKVILLKDIAKIGPKNSVVEVTDGYARNALIPQGKARQATPEALKNLEKKQADRVATRKARASAKHYTLERLSGETVSIKQKANEKGHLFAKITTKDIAEHLGSQGYEGIEPSDIHLKEPIKEVGEHTIQITANDEKAAFVLSVNEAG